MQYTGYFEKLDEDELLITTSQRDKTCKRQAKKSLKTLKKKFNGRTNTFHFDFEIALLKSTQKLRQLLFRHLILRSLC